MAAREELAQKRRAAFENEVRAYEQELLSYEARGRVLDRRIALAQQRVAREQARLDALQSALAERRKIAAARAAESALDSIQEAQSLSPEVRELVRNLAVENAELARVRTGESGVLESIDDAHAQAREHRPTAHRGRRRLRAPVEEGGRGRAHEDARDPVAQDALAGARRRQVPPLHAHAPGRDRGGPGAAGGAARSARVALGPRQGGGEGDRAVHRQDDAGRSRAARSARARPARHQAAPPRSAAARQRALLPEARRLRRARAAAGRQDRAAALVHRPADPLDPERRRGAREDPAATASTRCAGSRLRATGCAPGARWSARSRATPLAELRRRAAAARRALAAAADQAPPGGPRRAGARADPDRDRPHARGDRALARVGSLGTRADRLPRLAALGLAGREPVRAQRGARADRGRRDLAHARSAAPARAPRRAGRGALRLARRSGGEPAPPDRLDRVARGAARVRDPAVRGARRRGVARVDRPRRVDRVAARGDRLHPPDPARGRPAAHDRARCAAREPRAVGVAARARGGARRPGRARALGGARVLLDGAAARRELPPHARLRVPAVRRAAPRAALDAARAPPPRVRPVARRARSGARSSARSAEETGERHVLPEPELDLGEVDAQTSRLLYTSDRRRAADRALGALGRSRARARRAERREALDHDRDPDRRDHGRGRHAAAPHRTAASFRSRSGACSWRCCSSS